MTTTELSLRLLRDSGYQAAVCESWIRGCDLRRDLYGFADIIAIASHREPKFMLVQTTSLSNISSRLSKARSKPPLRTWLAAGGAFEVHGWELRAGRWNVKRVAVTTDQLSMTVIEQPPRRQKHRAVRELFE